ncbi:FHA domain-containing protein [Herbiconiux liangxiaofengii]|uniref:FHA domain-containing protein n=1 Tax=Herbiconiux liangxiaofengii TaxID=3342795 RepID=UPI0035BB1A38
MGRLFAIPGRGRWTVLVAWPYLVALERSGEGEGEGEVVSAVRAALAAGSTTLESVVSSIPVRGATCVDSFVVLRVAGESPSDHASVGLDSVVAVARGRGAVDLVSPGGSRRFGSRGAQPWALAEFGEVSGLVLGDLPPVPESELSVPAEAVALTRAHDEHRVDLLLWVSSARDAAHDSSDTSTAGGAGADDTTVLRPAPVPQAPVAPDETAEPEPEPEPEPERSEPRGPRFEFRLNDAPSSLLDGPVVFGRHPRHRTVASPPQTLVTVPSPQKKVSADHVEIAPSGRTVVVTDLHSSNGTTVVVDGIHRVRLRQGDSVVASRSAIVEIGDRNVIHISLRDQGDSGITP